MATEGGKDEFTNHDVEQAQAAVDLLKRTFDTVQVFCTRQQHGPEGEETINVTWGYGNWFARYGQVGRWLLKNDIDFTGETNLLEE